jgi:hypothetical protein
MIRLGCIALALACVGCTPIRTTIPAPYQMDGQKYETLGELESEATTRCEAMAGGASMPPHTFTTDGCSAYPESSAQRACCVAHDVGYWCGATPRVDVDRDFRRCLRQVSSAFNSGVMYYAVRLGGGRFSPFPWRYGYGHPWPHRKPKAPSEPRPQTDPTPP